MDLLRQFAVATVVFASTNVDDLFLLAAYFATAAYRTTAIVVGQFLGIGFLAGFSALAALAAFMLPPGWVALLGVVPLALGIRRLAASWGSRSTGAPDPACARQAPRRETQQALAVAGVTIANGGDNLGAYIPLFAHEPSAIMVCAAVFAVMTALWCLSGYLLARHRWIGPPLARYGHAVLPFVLMALGLYILADARMLLQ